MTSFSELPLSPALLNNLRLNGFSEPTSVQSKSIEPALEGRDLLVTAQTGTGKTLAFLLPLVDRIEKRLAQKQRGIGALILTPTRELALQIDEVFNKLARGTNVRSATAVGGVSERPQLRALRDGAQVLIATPGRLQDFTDRRLVRLDGVHTLVLDEADRMLDMGFLPAIQRIMDVLPDDRQSLFFSATIENSIRKLVESHSKNPVRIEIGSTSKPVAQVELRLYEVDQDRKLGLLTSMLKAEPGSYLVFARTKRGADRLSQKLSAEGVKTAAIHGDRSQSQRNQALAGFQSGYYRVLVATDVASRGIHVDGISHVVNFDLPMVPEDFIHRVGRTARAGAKGTASTFATRGERGEISRLERTIGTKLQRVAVPEGIGAVRTGAAPVEAAARTHFRSAPVAVPSGRDAAKRSFAPGKRRMRRRAA